jgi:hypothetical protein
MSHKKSKKHSRRDLLKHFGLGAAVAASSSPIEIFLDSFVEGLVSKAIAQEAKNESNKYIMIQQFGAPPRWMYDLFLQPYGGQVVKNNSVASELVLRNESGQRRYTEARYKTYNVKGIRAPHIWTQKVGSSRGGLRPVSDLMDNMLVIQGVDALNPGHAPAAGLQNRPLTTLSLDGVVADQSSDPFGALSFGSRELEYKSQTGRSRKHYTAQQDMAALLPKAFESSDIDINKKYKREISAAVLKLNASLENAKLGGAELVKNTKSAKDLMRGELDKLKSEYPALLKKYEKIIKDTLENTKSLKGFSDFPIGTTKTRTTLKAYQYNLADLFAEDADLRSVIDRYTIGNLAKQFAMTEYSIVNNLTSTASLNIDYARSFLNGRAVTITNDQHNTGSVMSVIFMTLFYRVSSACTLGLIDALKATPYKNSNLFDYTVIRKGSEFGRHPRVDGSGSDHAVNASSCMILSGMIKGPIVAGQILKNGATIGSRAGSWGAGGSLEHGPKATTGYLISTLAAMLGVPTPSVNNPSLIIVNSNGEVELNEIYIKKTKVV